MHRPKYPDQGIWNHQLWLLRLRPGKYRDCYERGTECDYSSGRSSGYGFCDWIVGSAIVSEIGSESLSGGGGGDDGDVDGRVQETCVCSLEVRSAICRPGEGASKLH